RVVRSSICTYTPRFRARLRDDYVADCAAGVGRWNRVPEKFGIPFQLKLPHVAFHRQIGEFSKVETDLDGNVLSAEAWEKSKGALDRKSTRLNCSHEKTS